MYSNIVVVYTDSDTLHVTVWFHFTYFACNCPIYCPAAHSAVYCPLPFTQCSKLFHFLQDVKYALKYGFGIYLSSSILQVYSANSFDYRFRCLILNVIFNLFTFSFKEISMISLVEAFRIQWNWKLLCTTTLVVTEICMIWFFFYVLLISPVWSK